MSNEYGSRSSRHERRSSRWAKKDSDVVEAAANQAIKHLEETEDQTAERTSRQKLTHEKNTQNSLSGLWITYGSVSAFSIIFLCISFVETSSHSQPITKPLFRICDASWFSSF